MLNKLPGLMVALCVSATAVGQFDPPVSLFSSGLFGSDLEMADLDGDGDTDAIAGGSTGVDNRNIIWYRNDGDGRFGVTPRLISNCSSVEDIFVADMDNDGDPDVLYTNDDDHTIEILYNLGNAEFASPAVLLTLSAEPTNVIAIDAGTDGDMDIICTTSGSSPLWFFANTGSGYAAPVGMGISVGNATDLRLTDTDNDGDPDILFSGSGGIYQVKNNGINLSNTSNWLSIPFATYGYCTADMNSDGLNDLIVVYDGGFEWHSNNGTTFSPTGQTIAWIMAFDVTAGDIDQDGDVDIACNVSDDYPLWLENTGGTFTQHSLATYPLETCRLADLNNDNYPELIITATSGAAYFPNNAGTFATAFYPFNQSTLLKSAIHSDVDGDGLQDIIYSHTTALFLMRGEGNARFSPPEMISTLPLNSAVVRYLAFHDLDGDGDNDFVASAPNDNLTYIFTNDGTGAFTYTSVPVEGCEAYLFLDYDNDGDTDFMTGHSLYLTLVRNMGNNTYTTVNFNTSSFQDIFALARIDYNGDGIEDVFTARTNHITCNPITASGTMGTSAVVLIPSLDLSAASFTDMDGDGDLDVLTGDENGVIGWYTNTNGALSGLNTIGIQPANIEFLRAEDFDADGDQDVFFNCLYTGLNYYENLGGGLFELHVANNSPVALYDFLDTDGDNDRDLIGLISGKYYEFINQLITPYQTNGSVFADLNGDGLRNGSDYSLESVKITVSPSETFLYSREDGSFRYHFDYTQPGTYAFAAQPDPDHWSVTAGSSGYSVVMNGPQAIPDSLYFGLYPLTSVDSLITQLVGGFPRCNTQVNYFAHIRNCGTTAPFILVDLDLSPDLTFISSDAAPDSIIGQHYYWHYDSLGYFTDSLIGLQVALPDFTASGSSVTSTLTATAIDENGNSVYSYTDTLVQTIVCAYDPNDKVAEPAGDGPEGTIAVSTGYIDYLIRFQNTGNDTAIQVVIRDVIDPHLIADAIVPLGSSHPVSVMATPDGVTFVFDAIYLPDSSANEPASHGFVSYRVPVMENLPYGTEIRNTAHIYFDDNPAVITNTTLHTIERPATFGSVTDTACVSYNSPSGNYTWTTSGTYTDTLTNWYAGDSIIFFTLHFPNQAGATYTSASSLLAYGGDPGANLQWISCGGGIVPGATSAAFTPVENGSYAVVITSGACADTSDCLPVTGLGLAEATVGISCKAAPNPSDDGRFTITASGSTAMTHWALTSIDGELVTSDTLQSCTAFDLTVAGAGGVYLLHATFSDGTRRCIRLVKTGR